MLRFESACGYDALCFDVLRFDVLRFDVIFYLNFYAIVFSFDYDAFS